MSQRRSRRRVNRAQKVIAIIVLFSLCMSGLAFYAAVVNQPATSQQIQQTL